MKELIRDFKEFIVFVMYVFIIMLLPSMLIGYGMYYITNGGF